MTKDEALKLALEAAYLAGFDASGEGYNAEYPFGDHKKNPEQDAAWVKDRDNALRQALAQPEQDTIQRLRALVRAQQITIDKLEAQPEQEPVAWVCHGTHGHHDIDFLEEDVDSLLVGTQLYTTPPQRKPLTDEEINAFFQGMEPNNGFWLSFARAIEAAHGIKGEA